MAKAKAKDGSNRGGARANSGRKPAASKAAIADFNAATLATLIGWLPDLLKNLKHLADGGHERVTEKFDADGILIERKVEIADSDRNANQYLIDRLLGKPTERKELTGEEGGPLKVLVTYADPGDPVAEAPRGPAEDPEGS